MTLDPLDCDDRGQSWRILSGPEPFIGVGHPLLRYGAHPNASEWPRTPDYIDSDPNWRTHWSNRPKETWQRDSFGRRY